MIGKWDLPEAPVAAEDFEVELSTASVAVSNVVGLYGCTGVSTDWVALM